MKASGVSKQCALRRAEICCLRLTGDQLIDSEQLVIEIVGVYVQFKELINKRNESTRHARRTYLQLTQRRLVERATFHPQIRTQRNIRDRRLSDLRSQISDLTISNLLMEIPGDPRRYTFVLLFFLQLSIERGTTRRRNWATFDNS